MKFVYTLSSKGDMIRDCIKSIKSLKSQGIDASDIVVFFTPPVNDSDKQKLNSLQIDLRLVGNQTDRIGHGVEEAGFGEKVQLCSVQDETVIFLDCDTLVLDNIQKSIEGDFDVKFRYARHQDYDKKWKELFRSHDKPPLPAMPNAGFLIFKNSTHQKIEEDWKRYIENVEFSLNGMKHQEQYALALSVSNGFEIEEMASHEHVFEFLGEKEANGIVYHLGSGENCLNKIILFTKRLWSRLPL